jgi:methyl-accepting chemotaxis protein
MDQVTQQNAAMVEQTSAAARNLVAEVTSLTRQSDKFVVNTPGRGSGASSAWSHKHSEHQLADATV